MFRKENISTSSTVNNDENQQVTDDETGMQIDKSLENMTDVSDESGKSTHDSDDSSNDSQEDELEIQDETGTIENNNQERKSVDGRPFLKIMQSHEHWETGSWPKKRSGYVNMYYWRKYEYWRTKAIKMWKHPYRTFLKHQESIRHVEATKKRQECKRVLTKGNIYKQMYEGQRVQKATIKAQNRHVSTKLFKTIYFVVKKNWAVRENFERIIAFL